MRIEHEWYKEVDTLEKVFCRCVPSKEGGAVQFLLLRERNVRVGEFRKSL